MSTRKRKASFALALFCLTEPEAGPKRLRRTWVKPYLANRKNQGMCENLQEELERDDPETYRRFMRMDQDTFQMILDKIRPLISKQDTQMRESIPAKVRLAVTLRFLATGDSYASLSFAFRVSVSSISLFIPVVCRAIFDSFRDEYMTVPNAPEDWKKVSTGFYERWNFPHCVGAVDGKHIGFKVPRAFGSLYRNYKGFDSIVMMAVVDHDYKFIYVDVGANGRANDGGIWNRTRIKSVIDNGAIGFPEYEPLPGMPNSDPLPFVLVGDEAFALSQSLMRPYPFSGLDHDKRVYNYRLSRARRVVENAFGILGNRFRVFVRGPIPLLPEKLKVLVMAACTLHNLLRSRSSTRYIGIIRPGALVHIGV